MPPKPQLWNASIACSPALAEVVAAALEDDAVSITLLIPPRTAMAQVDALYDHAPDAGALTAQLALLAALHRAKMPRFVVTEVGNLDWLKKVAADFPPLPIARWTVYGAEHRHKITNHRLALQIDATSAFGTGEHPTTRGCLLLLDELLKRRGGTAPLPRREHCYSMLDVGCGSGILAMGFAKACRGRAVAVDLDPDAVAIAAGNIGANGLRNHVRTARSFGYRNPLVGGNAPYDLIMANIFARPLCLMAKDLARHLRPGGVAILSGLLNSQANAVLAAHRQQGLYLIKRLRLGEWSVLALRRPLKAS